MASKRPSGQNLNLGAGCFVLFLLPFAAVGVFTSVHRSEMADVVTAMGMQAGTTVYYDVAVVRKNGKKVKVGRSGRHKREAECLAGTIRKAINY